MIYLENNVFEEALDRIRMVYDNHDDVIVSMSGGKDSTVLFELTRIVAREKGRLPIKVFWLDQEAEWQSTVNYMQSVMTDPEVEPYWYQIPFDFTNSLSPQKNFIRLWDEAAKDRWVHDKHPLSIKENPTEYQRFHELMENLPSYCSDAENCAVLVGMKAVESLNRKMQVMHSKALWHGITWCRKPIKNTRVFWPIYDFSNDDIWVAIGKNHWKYNQLYDWQYQKGTSKKDMRVSALIHETAWYNIEFLQEFEPKTYSKFTARVAGVSTYNHAFDMKEVIPKKLPFAFSSWKEYRDYLLLHITKPEYWDLFRRRWKGQDDDEWYKIHVKEILINDIDGTINSNKRSRRRMLNKADVYHNRDLEQYKKYMEEKNND